MLNLDEKCHNMQVAIDRFMAKLKILRGKEFLSPLVINDKLMTQLEYDNRLRQLAKQQASTSSIKELPTGKVLYNTFENLLFIQHEIKHLFITKPNFANYTEVDEIYRRMMNVKLRDAE